MPELKEKWEIKPRVVLTIEVGWMKDGNVRTQVNQSAGFNDLFMACVCLMRHVAKLGRLRPSRIITLLAKAAQEGAPFDYIDRGR